MVPLSGPLKLTVLCVFTRPKTGKPRAHHVTKPDLDNLVKFIADAGNGLLWEDDRQIVQIRAVKIYHKEAKTVLTVEAVENA